MRERSTPWRSHASTTTRRAVWESFPPDELTTIHRQAEKESGAGGKVVSHMAALGFGDGIFQLLTAVPLLLHVDCVEGFQRHFHCGQ
jgi:hypothetical protein